MKDKEREKGALFMIGEKEGAWLMCHWVGGEPDWRGDDPPNEHHQSPTWTQTKSSNFV